MENIKLRQHVIVYHQNIPFLNLGCRYVLFSEEKKLVFRGKMVVIHKNLSTSHYKPVLSNRVGGKCKEKHKQVHLSDSRRYDEEFKAGAVRLVVEQKRPVARVARELGVTADSLRSWVRVQTAGPADVMVQFKALQAEVKSLKKELADREETIEILKKAA